MLASPAAALAAFPQNKIEILRDSHLRIKRIALIALGIDM
jgi:hypothetical protein